MYPFPFPGAAACGIIPNMPALDLSAFERNVLADLLNDAAVAHREHGSNDYFLPPTAGNRALLAQVIAQQRDENDDLAEVTESKHGLFVFDFWLMEFLSARSASGAMLQPVELLALQHVLGSLVQDEFGEYGEDALEAGFRLAPGVSGTSLAKGVAAQVPAAAASIRKGKDGTILPRLALFAYFGQRCSEAAAAGGSASAKAAATMEAARPSLHPKWEQQSKRNLKDAVARAESQMEKTREELRSYVAHSDSTSSERSPRPGEVSRPDFLAPLANDTFSRIRHVQWENAIVTRRAMDWTAAADAFEAAWQNNHQSLGRAHWLRESLTEPWWKATSIADAAFGLVATTRTEAALQLARLQIEGIRRRYHSRYFHGPSTRFMVCLFADHLGLEPAQVTGDQPKLRKGEMAFDPWFDQLLAQWRSPHADALAPLLQVACDAHAAHAYFAANGHRREYDGAHFARTPIAALLVLRLREELGLPNPAVEHPMMEDMRPLLEARRQDAVVDDDLLAVRRRMEADGFDARKVLADLEVQAAGS